MLSLEPEQRISPRDILNHFNILFSKGKKNEEINKRISLLNYSLLGNQDQQSNDKKKDRYVETTKLKEEIDGLTKENKELNNKIVEKKEEKLNLEANIAETKDTQENALLLIKNSLNETIKK